MSMGINLLYGGEYPTCEGWNNLSLATAARLLVQREEVAPLGIGRARATTVREIDALAHRMAEGDFAEKTGGGCQLRGIGAGTR